MGFASRVTWMGPSALPIEAGFAVRNVPGQTIQFSRGALTVNPAEVIEGSFAEAGNRDVWVATWTEAGIADRVFPGPCKSAGPSRGSAPRRTPPSDRRQSSPIFARNAGSFGASMVKRAVMPPSA